MRRIFAVSAIMPLIAIAAAAGAQQVDAAGRTLGDCMVRKSTGEDRLVVARWLLAVMAASPQVADVATVSPGRKDKADRDMAALFTRLFVKDCQAEAKAVYADGAGGAAVGFRTGGEALGRVAMQELLGNPGAQAAFNGYLKFLNQDDFKGLMPGGK